MSPAKVTFDPPFERIARFYDAIYAAKGRDPVAEVGYLAQYWKNDGREVRERTVLDAACGTGAHLGPLGAHGRVEGLDRSLDMIAVARSNHPELPLHIGDLRSFQLNRRYDVVCCLFGSAGYLPTRPALRRAISALGMHVAAGGTLLIEPPLLEEHFDTPQLQRVETPFEEGSLVRETTARRDGSSLEIDFDWQQFDGEGNSLDRVRERHRLLLLRSKQWKETARSALPVGTRIDIDMEGPIGRGLLIARFSRSDGRGSG